MHGTKLTFFISLFLLSACTQKFKDSFSTVNASIKGLKDIELSEDELKDFPYDSAYVRLNDGRKILMVLALIEGNNLNNYQRFKWVSADSYILITENSRIVKSLGFKSNLIGINQKDNLNSNLPRPSVQTNKWSAYYDWMPLYKYHFSASINSKLVKKETVSLASWSLQAQHVKEVINFNELKTELTNHYWLNDNGQVVKSIQYLGPNMDKIEMSFVKSFLPK
ncbi:hypothetical protein TW85_05510 [Marinomonas sp. S3726]|nr:hypothetical protein TW85_05510 [Marinomonas sp. S3726]